MAHTVETLSKLLKKTPQEVVAILANAGIDGKSADSEISGEERKILMGSLSKRSSSKSGMSVSRREPSKSSPNAGGIKVQVKKKRVKKSTPQSNDPTSNEAALKAQEALDAGRNADEKLLAQDAKRQEMVRLQKEQEDARKVQKETADKPSEEAPKAETKDDKKPKRLRNAPGGNQRRQLHVAHKSKRKLKKKDRTRLSQKVQEEQAQHGFQKPVEKVIHEVPYQKILR